MFLGRQRPRYRCRRGQWLGQPNNRLQARAAHSVDGQGGGFFGYASLEHSLAGGVLTDTSGQHLTHDDFTDLIRGHLGTGQGFFDDDAAQLSGSNFGQRATKLAPAVRAAETTTSSSIVFSLLSMGNAA